MVIDPKDVAPFLDWLLPWGLLTWLVVVACVFLGVTAFGFLLAALRHGPTMAVKITAKVLEGAVLDFVCLSPRRAWAMAYLAIKESIRRRVVVVFAVFIFILLFAGWFLDPSSSDPARLYLDFVLTATSYLVLLLVLFLSSLSLPADLKNRTIYTVVTKPVRSSEVVLGRILGFAVVGTILLTVMGMVSYVFVVRGLTHTHALKAEDLQATGGPAAAKAGAGKSKMVGRTSNVNRHRHRVVVDADGQVTVELEQNHTHEVTARKDGDKTAYELGPAEGMLQARVPVYGKLSFLDRAGNQTDKGVNVGDEWTYRSYIEGGSLASCVWAFEGVTADAFPDGLPVEMTIEVFRTFKGDIEKGVPGSLAVRNPKTGKKAEVRIFESKEYATDSQVIPRELQLPDGKKADLFEDFVDDGKLDVILQCVAPQQYFGAAQADLYLRARDASFAFNFIKGYFGIWLQMVLIITLGVMFSTFLSGPVAMLATVGALLGGFFNDFMARLAAGQTYGGGPFESFIRILTQQNVTSEMESGLRTDIATSLDDVARGGLWVISHILPDFGHFNFAEYVACGFDISGDTILMFACRAFAFAVPVFIVGYMCLKNREIGK
jgi:ABC-type transport system involved in multi-copper enzyme maturation permease subunit